MAESMVPGVGPQSSPFLVQSSQDGGIDIVSTSGQPIFHASPWDAQPGWGINYFAVQPGITDSGGDSAGPVLFADGADTNVDAAISAKGTGSIIFGNGQGVNAQIIGPSSVLPIAWPVLQSGGANTGKITYGGITQSSTGGITQVQACSYNGTEPLYGVACGYSNYPGASRSFTAGGYCTVYGYGGIAIGNACLNYANFGVTLGNYGSDNFNSAGYYATQLIYSSTQLGNKTGSTQAVTFSHQCSLTGSASSPVTGNLTCTSSSVGISTTIPIPLHSAMTIHALVTAVDTITGDNASWIINALLGVGATVASAKVASSNGTGAPTFYSIASGSTNSPNSWSITLNTVNSGSRAYFYLSISIPTGTAGTDLVWAHARIDASQVFYG